MKQRRFIFTVSLLLFIITSSCPQTNSPEDPSIRGIFTASTPCSQGTRPLPGIPAGVDCELIKWNLVLYQDKSTKAPTTYTLHCSYGMAKQGTRGFIGGGKKIAMEGPWTIMKGTASNSHSVIYQLKDNKTDKAISFLRIGNDLLHLLDSDLRLMTGTAAWSYTLNRLRNE